MQGVRKLTAVQVGGAICLPVIMVGQMLGEAYGLATSLLAIVLGNGLLVVLSLAMSRLSTRHRQTTPEVAHHFLGRKGAALYAMTMLIVMVGWFAIQLDVMGLALGGGIGWNIGLGVVITAVAMGGLKTITRLATWSMPLLLATMGATAYLLSDNPTAGASAFSGLALSMVIATAIGAIFDLPTYFRHAATTRSAMVSAILAFGVAVPLVEGLGVYIGLKSPGLNLVEAMTNSGGELWGLWVALFLVLAGWTTNNANLYSAGACLHLLRPSLGGKKGTLLVGVTGTALSCLPLLANFELVLNLIGVVIITVGATVVASYILRRSDPRRNLVACGLGAAVGLLTTTGVFTLTGVPLLDAALASGLTTTLITRRSHAKVKA